MKERILQIILVLLLTFSVVPVKAFAEEGGDVNNTDQNQTIEVSQDPQAETDKDGQNDNDSAHSDNNDQPEEKTPAPGAVEEGEKPAEEDSYSAIDEDKKREEAAQGAKSEAVSNLLVEKKEGEENEESEEDEKYVRTIMMYVCGSDLESVSGLASYNLEQILNSNFSADDKIKFIVMTGGADDHDGWHLDSDYLFDPATGTSPGRISTDYNNIWEAKGQDANEYPGKLLLLDGDGIMGDGENARRASPVELPDGSIDVTIAYETMNDPEVLRDFINYCVDNYEAEEYDLILWDHGAGPIGGFGMDEHAGISMRFSYLYDALANNRVIEENGRFEIIDFDACLMNSVELLLSLMPYTDYYIASPEVVPGDGESYSGWLSMLADDPHTDAYELGKRLVDDYYQYYTDGPGKDSEATMALVNMRALEESGFLQELNNLNQILSSQLDNLLAYDELSSVLRSICYGNNEYYVDLGNIAAQIAIAAREFDEDRIPIGGKDLEVNEYYDTALNILNILYNESIFYNCCTKGIHTTGEIMFRDRNGDLKFGDDDTPLFSSGTYIFFTSVDDYRRTEEYDKEMDRVIAELPDGAIKNFFIDYCNTLDRYTLLIVTGQTVTRMINESEEYKKDDFNYQYVKDYWKINDHTLEEIMDVSDWALYVKEIVMRVLEFYGVEVTKETVETDCPAFLDWMERMIRQMAVEAIDKKKIELYDVRKTDGTGYRIKINDTKKRVIDRVNYDLLAELPIFEKYLDDEGIRWIFAGKMLRDLELSIGEVGGTELFDMDLDIVDEDDFITEYVKWLNGDTATWDLKPQASKWYAIKDAEGTLHVAAMEEYNGYSLVGTRMQVPYYDEEEKKEVLRDEMVALFFKDGDLVSFMIREDGAYRPVEAKDLKKELTLAPCLILDTIFGKYYGPISTEFTITPNNYQDIKLVYTDIDDIPETDISDLDGDGEKLTKRIVITDVYGSKIDITDMVNNPTGHLTDIEFVKVEDDEFTGGELNPRVFYNGKLLKENTDYKLTKFTDDVVFREIGEYPIFLQGIGRFSGGVWTTYNITPAVPRYPIIHGANAIWQKGSGASCDFEYERSIDGASTIDHFRSVKIDGKVIDSANYDVKIGSVIICLKPSYLETLSVGDHAITVIFDDNVSLPIRFTIRQERSDRKTEPSSYVFPITGVEYQPFYQTVN